MQSIREEARHSFNEAIDRVAQEAAKGGGATLTLVTFNHEVNTLLENAPAARANKLQPPDYKPDGMTALFDAVGQAIDVVNQPGPLGENDAALVIVVTDGHENSSKKVSQEQLVERMQFLEKTGAWTFTFMCANVDITDLSRSLGLAQDAMASWTGTKKGVAAMESDMLMGVSDYFAARSEGLRSTKDFWYEVKERKAQREDDSR